MVCPTCLNAGWVKDGFEVVRCPACHGAPNAERSSPNAYAAFLARDHAETAMFRKQMGLPSLGSTSPTGVALSPDAPPEGFAQGGIPVPTTVSDEQRERARAFIARNIAAVAAKMGEGR